MKDKSHQTTAKHKIAIKHSEKERQIIIKNYQRPAIT